nr:hypothetical protein Iba_chr04fCG5430 [Ipomoea batatas]
MASSSSHSIERTCAQLTLAKGEEKGLIVDETFKDHTFDFTKLCRPSLLTAALRPSLEVELLLFLVVVKTPTPEMEFVGEDPCSIMLLHREERRETKTKVGPPRRKPRDELLLDTGVLELIAAVLPPCC